MVAVDLMFLLGLRLATRECPHSNSQGASAPATPHIAWSVRVLGSGEAHDARRFPLSPRRDSPMTRHALSLHFRLRERHSALVFRHSCPSRLVCNHCPSPRLCPCFCSCSDSPVGSSPALCAPLLRCLACRLNLVSLGLRTEYCQE